jgi:hypothetical protein
VKAYSVNEMTLESLEHLTSTLNAKRLSLKLRDVDVKVSTGIPPSQSAKPVVIERRLVRLVLLEEWGD